jgi:ketosteroid isomerase-like protein
MSSDLWSARLRQHARHRRAGDGPLVIPGRRGYGRSMAREADTDPVALVSAAYENANTEDFDVAVARTLHPDCVWTPSVEFPEQTAFIGHDGARHFMRLFREAFDDFWMRPEEFIAVGSQVIVPLHIGGTLKGSKTEVTKFYVHLWTIRDGLAVRVQTFLDLEEARAAAAAAEQPG